jgi:arylsulfatase A-like enzyme
MRKATALRRPYSASQQAVLKGVYDATLVDLDRSTKRIFEDLDSRGALDNTIVLLTSDHGEAFGEHGYYRHNRGLHQEMVRVPLVLWYPKKVKSGRMDEPVSTAAVFGEVCRLVDAACPQTDGFIQGGLIAPTSEPIIADGRQPVGKRKKRDPKYMWEDLMAIYMDGWKMILGDDGTQELYRIDPDDMEQENVHADHPEVATKLASRLEQWKQQTPRRLPGQQDNPSGTDENMEGLLKTLGYLE